MLKIGTRGSELALFQARTVQRVVNEKLGLDSKLVIIKTQGDKKLETSLEELEGKGFFTKEIEDALLSGEIDAAVHSLKDLPTQQPLGLEIAAFLKRDDPSELLLVRPEAFVSNETVPVKAGARVGTSSTRRKAQLKALRHDIALEDLRGNVPTRIRKLREGKYDAILIAKAGVDRLELKLDGLTVKVFDPRVFIPAPGQGIIVVETRSGSEESRSLKAVNDERAEKAAAAERKLLALLEGGCRLPLGAFAEVGQGVQLWAVLGDVNLSGTLGWVNVEAETPEKAARQAFRLLRERNGQWGKKLLLVTREENRSRNLAALLEPRGVEVLFFPTFEIVAETDGPAFKEAAVRLPDYGWIFFTSQVAVEHFFDRFLAGIDYRRALAQTRFAAIGEATKKALEERGVSAALVPSVATSEALAEAFLKLGVPKEAPLLFPTAEKTRGVLEELLGKSGYSLTRLVLYSIRPLPPERFAPLDGRKIDYVLFTSSESARSFLKARPLPAETKVVTIGPVTSATVRELGLSVYRELPEAKIESVAQIF